MSFPEFTSKLSERRLKWLKPSQNVCLHWVLCILSISVSLCSGTRPTNEFLSFLFDRLITCPCQWCESQSFHPGNFCSVQRMQNAVTDEGIRYAWRPNQHELTSMSDASVRKPWCFFLASGETATHQIALLLLCQASRLNSKVLQAYYASECRMSYQTQLQRFEFKDLKRSSKPWSSDLPKGCIGIWRNKLPFCCARVSCTPPNA